jgi:hypothetical protein
MYTHTEGIKQKLITVTPNIHDFFKTLISDTILHCTWLNHPWPAFKCGEAMFLAFYKILFIENIFGLKSGEICCG